MSLIVQKFGGTSVSNPESLKTVANKIIACKESGNEVVVVVSAMGSSTDELIDLAGELSETPSPREMDMLLSAGERITMSLLAIHLKIDDVSFFILVFQIALLFLFCAMLCNYTF